MCGRASAPPPTATRTSTAHSPTPRWSFTDQFIATAPSLDITGQIPDAWRGPMSLRWVLVHVVEEYARHNGHADLLRERIDGRIGQ
jgi:hypothetical protein